MREAKEIVETKPISAAQREHLASLLGLRQRVEEEIGRFVEYLRREHNAPSADGWNNIDAENGFTRQASDIMPQ